MSGWKHVAGILGSLVLLAASVGPSYAQPPQQLDPSLALNYAFATQLGSGIYRIGDQTVQIYRISTSVPLVSMEGRAWGLGLRIPLTFGFYNFELGDILDGVIPSSLGTLALVPTLELEVPIYDNWSLGPFFGFGGGKDFSGGEFSFIFATGIHSLAIFPWEERDIRLSNRLVYSGYTTKSLDFTDDFAMLETGVDIRRRLGFAIGGYDIDGSVFAVNYLYFISPHVIRLVPEPIEMRTQWELGVTTGTAEPWKVLGIGMPRLGLSYRFGGGENAWRIVIGNPFPIDSPRDSGAAVN